MNYLLVFILQVCFNICKSLEIRFTYENRLWPILVVGLALSAMTILGVYISIGAMLEGDYYIIGVYMVGSVVGKYISFMINRQKYRNKVYNLISKK